ncbi:MAG: hypothetical protein KDD11_18695 [Acidobacteria bacterium]|nr:hypothetical protein [Acidobacteriota bacterium]
MTARALLTGLLVVGCAAPRPAPTVTPPVVPTTPEAPAVSPGSDLPAPLSIPPDELETQSLFRFQVAGPDVDAGFRLTLRLENRDRFQLQAVDPVGRALWTLDADGDAVLWLEHRDRRVCRFDRDIELPGLSMGEFPVAALPALLLGGLPVRPGAPPRVQVEGDARHLDLLDDGGRHWTATYRAGKLLRWTLWRGAVPGVGDPAAQLRRDPPWWILVDRRQDLEIRWRRVVREALAAPPSTPEIPEGYGAEGCPSAI